MQPVGKEVTHVLIIDYWDSFSLLKFCFFHIPAITNIYPNLQVFQIGTSLEKKPKKEHRSKATASSQVLLNRNNPLWPKSELRKCIFSPQQKTACGLCELDRRDPFTPLCQPLLALTWPGHRRGTPLSACRERSAGGESKHAKGLGTPRAPAVMAEPSRWWIIEP